MAKKHQISFHVDDETAGQVDALCEVFRGSRSSIIRQAIARWYHDEPLLKGKLGGKKANGLLPEEA